MPTDNKIWVNYLPEGLYVEFIAAVRILVSHLHNRYRFTGRHFSLKLRNKATEYPMPGTEFGTSGSY
jgi:hypothetical protein